MKQIHQTELPNYIGREIILINGRGESENVTLVSVRENAFSAKIKRNDWMNGIEPWFSLPLADGDKIYINE